jgi:hypothetical protein
MSIEIGAGDADDGGGIEAEEGEDEADAIARIP